MQTITRQCSELLRVKFPGASCENAPEIVTPDFNQHFLPCFILNSTDKSELEGLTARRKTLCVVTRMINEATPIL